jgi:uncharacterized protein YlxW (UPF0749 family)
LAAKEAQITHFTRKMATATRTREDVVKNVDKLQERVDTLQRELDTVRQAADAAQGNKSSWIFFWTVLTKSFARKTTKDL